MLGPQTVVSATYRDHNDGRHLKWWHKMRSKWTCTRGVPYCSQWDSGLIDPAVWYASLAKKDGALKPQMSEKHALLQNQLILQTCRRHLVGHVSLIGKGGAQLMDE